jgi:hypothetical protein
MTTLLRELAVPEGAGQKSFDSYFAWRHRRKRLFLSLGASGSVEDGISCPGVGGSIRRGIFFDLPRQAAARLGYSLTVRVLRVQMLVASG